MYVRHYGLTARPFQLTPSVRFFFPSRAHRAALKRLVSILEGPSGIALLSGDLGVGKTILLEVVASIVARGRLELVRSDAREPLAPQLRVLIQGADRRQRRVLVLGDEAESLSEEDLGALRRLLDWAETDGSPVHAVLASAASLEEVMTSGGPVRERIVASNQLGRLDADEIRPYAEHRLTRAGWTGRPAFADSVDDAIHRHTGGNPRAVNLLMSRTLLLAALDRMTTIDRFALDRAAAGIADEDAPLRPGAAPPPPADPPPQRGREPRAHRAPAGGTADPPGSDPDASARSELENLRRQLYRLDLERLRQDTETSRRLVAALLRQRDQRTARRFPFLPRFARSF